MPSPWKLGDEGIPGLSSLASGAHDGAHSPSNPLPSFDTSGTVRLPLGSSGGVTETALYRWPDLTPFAQGYVEALFAEFNARAGEAYEITQPAGFSHLSPEALALILRDCEPAPNSQAAISVAPHIAAELGRQFWARRQAGEYRAFPPLTPYLSDDGKVCLREAGQ